MKTEKQKTVIDEQIDVVESNSTLIGVTFGKKQYQYVINRAAELGVTKSKAVDMIVKEYSDAKQGMQTLQKLLEMANQQMVMKTEFKVEEYGDKVTLVKGKKGKGKEGGAVAP